MMMCSLSLLVALSFSYDKPFAEDPIKHFQESDRFGNALMHITTACPVVFMAVAFVFAKGNGPKADSVVLQHVSTVIRVVRFIGCHYDGEFCVSAPPLHYTHA